MLNEIIKTISPRIQALPFVERYGGLVRTAQRVVNMGTPDEPRNVRQSFPVSCSVSHRDCWEQGRFTDLVPNDAHKSIFYFEEITPLTFTGMSKDLGKRDVQVWEGRVRLIGWLNLPALGIDSCQASAGAVGSVIKAIGRGRSTSLPWNATIEFNAVQQQMKSEALFNRYSYSDKAYLFFWPYDCFGLDVQVKMYIQPKCLPDLEIGDPIPCVDLSLVEEQV